MIETAIRSLAAQRLPTPRLGAMIILIGTLVAIGLAATAPARSVENRLADFRRSLHEPHMPYSERVVVIAIDDQTMADLPYASPIDRTLLASVVAELDKRNPRVIGLDVLIDRPSDPAADQALFDAIEAAEAPVVAVFDPGAARLDACTRSAPAIETPASGQVLAGIGEAAILGHGVQCVDGVDNVLRRGTYREAGGMQAFAKAMAEAGGLARGGEGADIAPLPIALGSDGGWPFTTLSAAHIEHVPDAWIAGRHVLVGQITPYSGDWRLTPLRFASLTPQVEPAGEMPPGQMPGVVLHAFALEALLTGQRGPKVSVWASGLAALLGAVAGAALGAARAQWWGKLLGVALLAGVAYWASFSAYAWMGWLVPYTPAALGLVLTSGAGLALMEREERLRRQSVHNAFQHFLAPQVVDQLVQDPDLLALTAEERDISAMFTDLAGFTRFIDEQAPAVAAEVLNGYLDIIVQEVMDHGGAVDKIVGDAVHALFSAPIEDPGHRLKAVRCALAIQVRTEAYREGLLARDIALGETRIGLNAGMATVGNFGASRRLDYTAHGSTINLAARLEEANKILGTRICLTDASRVDADGLAYRTIGRATARGLVDPVTLFELCPVGGADDDRFERYEAALATTDPGDAEGRLQSLLEAAPEDGLVAFQLKRIAAGEWGQVIAL